MELIDAILRELDAGREVRFYPETLGRQRRSRPDIGIEVSDFDRNQRRAHSRSCITREFQEDAAFDVVTDTIENAHGELDRLHADAPQA